MHAKQRNLLFLLDYTSITLFALVTFSTRGRNRRGICCSTPNCSRRRRMVERFDRSKQARNGGLCVRLTSFAIVFISTLPLRCHYFLLTIDDSSGSGFGCCSVVQRSVPSSVFANNSKIFPVFFWTKSLFILKSLKRERNIVSRFSFI